MACLGEEKFTFLLFTSGKKEEWAMEWKVTEKLCFYFRGLYLGYQFPSPRRPKKVAKFSQNQHRWGWPKVLLPELFRVLFTCRAAGKRPTVRPLEVEAGERDGEATENQDIWRKTRFDRNVRGLEAEMIQGKASTLEEAEMTHTHMDEHSPMHIDLTNTSACRYIYVCNVSPRVHVCILSCWHIH